MGLLQNFNYVYKIETLVVLGIIVLLLYVFYELKVFDKKGD